MTRRLLILLMSSVRVAQLNIVAVVSCNKFLLYPSSIVCRHTLSQFVRHVVTMSEGNYCDCILLSTLAQNKHTYQI